MKLTLVECLLYAGHSLSLFVRAPQNSTWLAQLTTSLTGEEMEILGSHVRASIPLWVRSPVERALEAYSHGSRRAGVNRPR